MPGMGKCLDITLPCCRLRLDIVRSGAVRRTRPGKRLACLQEGIWCRYVSRPPAPVGQQRCRVLANDTIFAHECDRRLTSV